MKKQETVWARLLQDAFDGKRTGTQAEVCRKLCVSLSTVHAALMPLRQMGAVQVKSRSFTVQDPKKILLHWASRRQLEKDITYKTRVNLPVDEIEKSMPGGTVFTAYTGFKLHFKHVPADYSEVYAYVDDPAEVEKRFPQQKGPPNLFTIKKAPVPVSKSAVSLPHLYVDLWNLPTWYAKEYLTALEGKLHGIMEG